MPSIEDHNFNSLLNIHSIISNVNDIRANIAGRIEGYDSTDEVAVPVEYLEILSDTMAKQNQVLALSLEYSQKLLDLLISMGATE